MPTIEFDKETVASLQMQDMPKPNGYNSFGLSDLSEREQSIFSTFINYLMSADVDINEEDILLVKAKDGMVDKVYAPRLVRDEDQVMLQFGGNAIPVTVNAKGAFQVGSLSGVLTFPAETKYFAKVQDPASGEEIEVPQYNGTLALRPPAREKSDWEFRVSVPLAPDVKRTGSSLQNSLAIIGDIHSSAKDNSDNPEALKADTEALKAELADLPNYFYQLKKGGGSGDGEYTPTIKMRDMEVGDYTVVGVKTISTDNGESHVLTLDDGRSVWSQGSSKMVLSAPDLYQQISGRLSSGEKMTLKITKITKKGEPPNEKTYVDHALRYGAPKTAATSTPVSKPANIRTNAAAAGAAVADRLPSKAPVAVAAGIPDEDIPF